MQCTQQEICDFLEVDHKTLTRWCKRTYKKEYSQVYAEKKSGGKISLRRAQFQLAQRSAAMAIFLGKNILGQSDNPDFGSANEAAEHANQQINALADMINRAQPAPDIGELIAEAAEAAPGGDGA